MASNRIPSPQTYARIGGLLYLIIIISGFSAEFFFRRKIIVGGDPAATLNNMMTSPGLWRLGIALEYFCIICTLILAMIYYFLLKPVNKELNLLATFFRLVSITVQAVALLYLIEALFPAKKELVEVFTAAQLYSMSNFYIRSHEYGYSISLLLLGCCFLIHGYLIFKSGFLPGVLGILIQIAGTGYIINGFTHILEPSLTRWTFPIFILPVLVAETSLSVWLLVKGVDVTKWKIMESESYPANYKS